MQKNKIDVTIRTQMNSHLVSRNLLRRFCINNSLLAHDFISNKDILKNPEQISYIKMPISAISTLEQDWGIVEGKMTKIYPSIDDETVLKSVEAKEIIKKFIALHFVRSQSLIALIGKDEKKYFEQAIEDSKKADPLSAEAIENNRLQFREKWLQTLKLETLPEMYKNHIQKSMDFIMRQDIEIGEVIGDYELALSDSPVINLNELGHQGILEGVPINESINCFMPLGPRHVVALTKKAKSTEYITMTSRAVERMNYYSVYQSIKYYYFRKGKRGIIAKK
jgi:hypothetical protein